MENNKQSGFAQIAKPTLILTAICTIVTLLLAMTNMLTAGKIAANAAQKAAESRKKVLAAADYKPLDKEGNVYGAYDENAYAEGDAPARAYSEDAEELSFEKAIDELSQGDESAPAVEPAAEPVAESAVDEQNLNAEAPAEEELILSDVTDEPFVTSDGRFVPVVRPGKEEILEGAAAAGLNPKTVIHEPTGITFVDYSEDL